MDSKTATKLDAVLAKESERRKQAAEANAQREAKVKTDNQKKEAARARWITVQTEIRRAIDDVNDRIEAAGLRFETSERIEVGPAIAQMMITLLPKQGGTLGERQVVVNVDAFGSVVLVFCIPHTGKAPDLLSLEETSREFWANALVDFLDQTLAYEDKKKAP